MIRRPFSLRKGNTTTSSPGPRLGFFSLPLLLGLLGIEQQVRG